MSKSNEKMIILANPRGVWGLLYLDVRTKEGSTVETCDFTMSDESVHVVFNGEESHAQYFDVNPSELGYTSDYRSSFTVGVEEIRKSIEWVNRTYEGLEEDVDLVLMVIKRLIANEMRELKKTASN
jgi:hypothetical protein